MDRLELQSPDEFNALINELLLDEAFRATVRFNTGRSLAIADDGGLPLCDSEIRSLMAADRALWESVAEDLGDRWQDLN